jgi:hypothetical protein
VVEYTLVQEKEQPPWAGVHGDYVNREFLELVDAIGLPLAMKFRS